MTLPNTHRFEAFLALCALWLSASICNSSAAQEVTQTGDGVGKIIIETHRDVLKLADFYTAVARATVHVETDHIEQEIQLSVKIVQGEAKTLTIGLIGNAQVIEVIGDTVSSWSIRQEGEKRFLDIRPTEMSRELRATVRTRSATFTLPAVVDLSHFAPGKAVGFDSIVHLEHAKGVTVAVTEVDGFVPVGAHMPSHQFQTTTGGKIQLTLNRDGVTPGPVELVDTQLTGELHPNGKSMSFRLSGTAHVTERQAELTILAGNAAVDKEPTGNDERLQVAIQNDQPVYKLVFPETGQFPFTLDFVAPLDTSEVNWRSVDFTVAAGAVVPLTIKGLSDNLEFHRDPTSLVPSRENDTWIGFLPATGHARLQWKMARDIREGKLFYSTTARIEASVGAGLLRQDHVITYQVLQGELSSISMQLTGPGEILDVRGNDIVAWHITGEGNDRQLNVTLGQPISNSSEIAVRSQTPFGAFPVRIAGLRLIPMGAIRHSGHVRITNSGDVRIEPTSLQGLTQLAPDQFPGDATDARQTFVYRFPASDYAFSVAADRIQPEINISQLVLYEFTETDRVIRADIELDIREAPIREWDFDIPADYSVVAVTGATVADYNAATESTEGRRNLKIMFEQDVSGRQLVSLQLERNEAANAGDWILPHIEYPEAKTVRGDIGIIGAPGFRIAVKETSLLVEKPLSYFPKPATNLQQAFRIREPGWSATMSVERLERSVQTDVFHLYSLSEETVFGSVLINYFVTGAPVSEWRVNVPESLENIMVDGKDVRNWRRDGNTLIITLHQPVMGAYTLLVTFEEKPDSSQRAFQAGQIEPLDISGERGFIQVVSPRQVEINTLTASNALLQLEPLELPAEFRLLSTAPVLGTWQYTERPFEVQLQVNWFEPGRTVPQVVEYAEANSRVSQDGEWVTDILYYVKSRGQTTLRITLPSEPVRLWDASVNGEPVTARQTEDATLIPLAAGVDTNVPVEVHIRLGKPSVNKTRPVLTLPVVYAPVLKTQWHIEGDESRVLVPARGTIHPADPVLPRSGFDWVAKRGLRNLVAIGLLMLLGMNASRAAGGWHLTGVLALLLSVVIACVTASQAYSEMGTYAPLQLSLPILSAEETVELEVTNVPLWRADYSWIGLGLVLLGSAAIICSYVRHAKTQDNSEKTPVATNADDQSQPPNQAEPPTEAGTGTEHVRGGINASLPANSKTTLRATGIFLFGLGALLHRDAGTCFFGFVAISTSVLALMPMAWVWLRQLPNVWQRAAKRHSTNDDVKSSENSVDQEPGGSAVVTKILLATLLVPAFSGRAFATQPAGFESADTLGQQWRISQEDTRLNATGSVTLTGNPGDRFVLLKAPAVLTRFEGTGLRLTKHDIPNYGLAYIVSIPQATATQATAEVASESAGAADEQTNSTPTQEYSATFDYQLETLSPTEGVPVLTGLAAVQKIDVRYDKAGWEVTSPQAVRIEPIASEGEMTEAKVLLGLGDAVLFLRPKARDVTTEQTQFFVEASTLYLLGPGVVDGRHRLQVRTSQGQVSALTVQVPLGLTVSAVDGPVGSWHFDAESGRLQLEVEPAQSQNFTLLIDTQRGLDTLPVNIQLAAPLVTNASGQVGLLAIAFSPDAQPEKMTPSTMSAVSLGDFDASLTPNSETLYRVYRYGEEGGELDLRVAPVAAEVRVVSRQVLSLGDERIVLGITFATEITRAGLFQLSFVLPDGVDVESLTGDALHHWSELSENGQRKIILHLNGKTTGTHEFSLTLAGPAPTNVENWDIPRFQLNEATRQSGELVVRPTTGLRLRTLSRQNASETDARTLGGQQQGALAFRLLQRDWELTLGIEKLEPWVTGQILHEVSLREGQTRTALLADFEVQNASIRTLQIELPITDADEIKTLRASGSMVSDLVRTAPNSNIWEIHLKRRVVGKLDFRIEFERRGEQENQAEILSPAAFPQVRQLSYYFIVRTSGRLETKTNSATQGWQLVDWNAVPQSLRDAGNRVAPAHAFRVMAPRQALTIQAARHSVADALKLRVTQGALTTVLSSSGDQLTAVNINVDVIQRSSLSVGLAEGGELLSIFVNGESVNLIRKGGDRNAWQFYILPGIDDHTATVQFVYSVKGDRLNHLTLVSPQLDVPLENIEWNVVAPKDYQLIDNDGNLELAQQKHATSYDRESYLSKVSGNRQQQAQQAAKLLEQANQLLQAGEQSKARWALNSVANQYALDAASNEDARVQLENLQTQQAIVGLNTRRQRLYLDNDATNAAVSDNQQLREAAAVNPILQQDQLNFRPQEVSQLLAGNTSEDNEVLQQIAGRLVHQQRSTEPALQSIIISLPEEGSIYTFRRSVQVAVNTPLELDLRFRSRSDVRFWQGAVIVTMVAAFAAAMVRSTTRQRLGSFELR